jgi:hypothetical protein
VPGRSGAANVNGGHIAFQWRVGSLIYGLSAHGMSEVNRRLVARVLDQADLVEP